MQMMNTLHQKKHEGIELRYESEILYFHSRAYETRLSLLSPKPQQASGATCGAKQCDASRAATLIFFWNGLFFYILFKTHYLLCLRYELNVIVKYLVIKGLEITADKIIVI